MVENLFSVLLKTSDRSKRENLLTGVLHAVLSIEPRLVFLILSDLFKHDEYMRLYVAGLDSSLTVDSQVRLKLNSQVYVVDIIIRIPKHLCIFIEVKIDAGFGKRKSLSEKKPEHQLSAYMKLLDLEKDYEHRYLVCLTRRKLQLPAKLRHPRILTLRWDRIFDLTLRYLHRDLKSNDGSASTLIVSHFLEYLEKMGLSQYDSNSKAVKEEAIHRYRTLVREASRRWGILYTNKLPEAILDGEGKVLTVEVNPGFDVQRENIRFMHKGRAIPISLDLARSILQQIVLSIGGFQADYLAGLNPYPGPLTINTVAAELNIHPSLVSRLVAGCTVLTQKGFLPLRSLLQLGIATKDGQISIRQLEDRLSYIVSQENPKYPLSDQDLTRHLNQEGILLSRRSVAKYRKRLGIPCFRIRTNTSKTGIVLARPRILVVDDDPIIRCVVKDVLVPEGYAVSSACEGIEALDLIKKRPYDLVLLDLKMPGPDGLEILRRIKRISNARVILMTGYATIETAKSAINHGAEDYVEKPLSPNRLRLLARGIMEGPHLEKVAVTPKILVVDDDEIVLATLRDILQPAGFTVTLQSDPVAALALMRQEAFNILIADLKMMQMDGLALIQSARDLDPELITLVITGYPSIETVVSAMKDGVYDYITKPIHPKTLLASVRRAWEKHRLSILNAQLLASLRRKNEELTRSRDQMAKILEVMNDALFVTDLAGIVQMTNSAAQKLLGREEREIVGEPLRRFVAPENEGRSLLSAGRIGEIEDYVEVKLQGKRVSFSVGLSISHLESSGKPMGYVIVARDLRQVHTMIENLDLMRTDLKKMASQNSF